MVLDEIGQLFFQSGAKSFGIHCEIDLAGLPSADIKQSSLHTAIRVFQTKIEDRAFVCMKVPHRFSHADAMCKP